MNPKTRIAPYTLGWLLSPDDEGVIRPDAGPDVGTLPYALPPEAGKAWAEFLALRDGIVLFRAVHALEPSPAGQLVSLLDVHTAQVEAVFTAQIWLSGLGCHREYWHGRDQPPVDIVAGPGRDTFRHHQAWQAKVMTEGGVTSEMRSVIVPDSMLKTLLGEDAAQHLLDTLGLGEARPTVVRALPIHVSAPLKEALSNQFSGVARKLYAQARVLDYLAGLLHHVSTPRTVMKERSHRKLIHDLHHHLVHLEGRMPTLNELAISFGLSARRMNAEFVTEYGQSIFNFVTDYRLDQAHASLLIEAMPMKVLAARLGYSHVNHFIAAFKRKFGYPPGSLRRR